MNVLKSTSRLVDAAGNFGSIEPTIVFHGIADPGNANGREDAYGVDGH